MKESGYLLAGLVLLVLLYVGSYLAMVEPNQVVYTAEGATPAYRLGGKAAKTLFFPAFALDRQFRPERWPPLPVVIIEDGSLMKG